MESKRLELAATVKSSFVATSFREAGPKGVCVCVCVCVFVRESE